MSRTAKLGLVLALSVMLGGAAASADEPFMKDLSAGLDIPAVVARVNGADLPAKYVRFELNRLLRNADEDLGEKQKKEIVRDIIDKEVVRELIFQAGKEKRKEMPADAVREEFERLKAEFADEAEFARTLKQRDVTEAEIQKSIEVDLVVNRLLEEEVNAKINITDDQTRKYYEENKERFQRPESFHILDIFVSSAPPEPPDAKKKDAGGEAEKKIHKIYKDLKAGADFAALAKKYSDDADSAARGGDLDFVYKGTFDPAFDAALAKLKPGETSGVVKTGEGYHIVKLNETRPADTAPFAEVKEAIQQALFVEKTQALIEEYVKNLKAAARIEVFY